MVTVWLNPYIYARGWSKCKIKIISLLLRPLSILYCNLSHLTVQIRVNHHKSHIRGLESLGKKSESNGECLAFRFTATSDESTYLRCDQTGNRTVPPSYCYRQPANYYGMVRKISFLIWKFSFFLLWKQPLLSFLAVDVKNTWPNVFSTILFVFFFFFWKIIKIK